MLVSRDSGKTWSRLDGLNDHPSVESWNPGAAGPVLHTIVADPSNADKLWTGISAAGVFATEDGGKSWDRRNRLSDADACNHHNHPAAPGGGEVGHCVHNMTLAPGSTDLLYRQNHHGVRRSTDGGRNWRDKRTGPPQKNRFFTVLRQAMARDERDPVGIYFGTNSGSVFAGIDEGVNREEIARRLPTTLSVEALDRRDGPIANRKTVFAGI